MSVRPTNETETGMILHRIATFSLMIVVSGCGATSRPADTQTQSISPSGPNHSVSISVRVPEHTITRSAVRAVISRGLGAFLRGVELDEQPVFLHGRFHGFRIARLRDPASWSGIDVKPGDVITSVGNLPIERPEQAQAAFDSLATAPEIRVAFERDGRPVELLYPIVDDP